MAQAYEKFADKHGNEYGFGTYLEFAEWWYSHSRHSLVETFEPQVFNKLQNAAYNSTEARKPAYAN